MVEFKFIITDPDGIHARPAGNITKIAKGFESDITIGVEGKTADAKKLFALMGLAAKQGNELTISVSGTDEKAAADAVQQYLTENL